MHSLTHTAAMTEGKAMDIIFNACRANAKRNAVTTKCGHAVTFKKEGAEHKATATCANGFVVAVAYVDHTDC